MIGIPSTVSLPQCEITNSMFFVVVCPVTKVGGRKAPPFENLRLSSQLGKGMWRGLLAGALLVLVCSCCVQLLFCRSMLADH